MSDYPPGEVEEPEIVFAQAFRTGSGKIIADPETGMPIMLAVRKPGQVAAQPDPSGISIQRGASSGNPNADPRTGQFSKGGGSKQSLSVNDPVLWAGLSPETKAYINVQVKTYGADSVVLKKVSDDSVNVTLRTGAAALTSFSVQISGAVSTTDAATDKSRSTIPDGVDPEVWNRRLDMVRAAARENDEFDEGDLKEFLTGRVKNMDQVDIASFLADVRAQRMDDLLDILDQQTRPKIDGMKISRRMVKMSAPKGFSKRVFNGLSDDEVISLVKRLEGRGYDPDDLNKFVISGITNESRRTKLQQLYGESKPKSGKKSK
jgi:hypothetical protein